MNRFFNMDSPFFIFMSKVADLFILNLLCLICCIPIITIGASVTAMYYVTLKMARNEESYVVKSFFKSFKENFRQATILHLISVLIGVVVYIDYIFFLSLNSNGTASVLQKIIMIIFLVTVLFLFFTYLYIYPLLSRFYNSVSMTMRNAFYMSIRHLPRTLLIALTSILPIGLLFIPVAQVQAFMIPLLLFFGLAGIAAINSKSFVKIFDQYTETDDKNESANNTME
ncbi:MAG: YesL family protein [Eubacteriales bacterium]|nr:YesL family protein [Eubacteriales bacterium]